MMRFSINEAKALFLDTRTLDNSMESMRKRVTVQQTNLVRKIAQRSMRPGGKKMRRSLPGQPPRTHGQRKLRKLLYSGYDPSTKSSLAGPALLVGNMNQQNFKFLGSITVPEILEVGGKMMVQEVRAPKDRTLWKYLQQRAMMRGEMNFDPSRDWSIVDRRFANRRYDGAEMRTRTAFMDKRPYMMPAKKVAMPKFAAMYANQFKKAA
jgi:hypothetical protein